MIVGEKIQLGQLMSGKYDASARQNVAHTAKAQQDATAPSIMKRAVPKRPTPPSMRTGADYVGIGSSAMALCRADSVVGSLGAFCLS